MKRTMFNKVLCLVFALTLAFGSMSIVAFADEGEGGGDGGGAIVSGSGDGGDGGGGDGTIGGDDGGGTVEGGGDGTIGGDDEAGNTGGESTGTPKLSAPASESVDLDALKELIENKKADFEDMVAAYQDALDAFETACNGLDAANQDYEALKADYDALNAAYEALKASYVAGAENVSYDDVVAAREAAQQAFNNAEAARITASDALDAAQQAWEDANAMFGDISELYADILALIADYDEAAAAANDEAGTANAEAWATYWSQMKDYSNALAKYVKASAAKISDYKKAMKVYEKKLAQWELDTEAYQQYLNALAEYEAYDPDNASYIVDTSKNGVSYQGGGNFANFKKNIDPKLPDGVTVKAANSQTITFEFDGATAGYIDIAIKVGGGNNKTYYRRVFVEPNGTYQITTGMSSQDSGTDFQVFVGKYVQQPTEPTNPGEPGEQPPLPCLKIDTFNEKLPSCPKLQPTWDSVGGPTMPESVGFEGIVNSLDSLSGLPNEPEGPGPGPDPGPGPATSHHNTPNPPAPQVAITEPETPLAVAPETEVIIPDDEVPLSDIPQTGIDSIAFSLGMLGLSLMALLAMPFIKRRVED